jgi:hypothetical protein
LNLSCCYKDLSTGGEFFKTNELEPDMPKVVRAAAISVPSVSSSKLGYNQFVIVALFSGIGLLASLIAILSGMQITAWY